MKYGELIWSLVTVGGIIGASFLLRDFSEGARTGDPEGYLAVGAIILGVLATAALEKRFRAHHRK